MDRFVIVISAVIGLTIFAMVLAWLTPLIAGGAASALHDRVAAALLKMAEAGFIATLGMIGGRWLS